MISKLIDSMGVNSVLDYGCGDNRDLAKTLNPEGSFKYQAFDSTIPKYSDDPISSEMVVCIDSLSDIDPWEVDDVLDKIEELTEFVLFITLNTERMTLNWWLPRIMDRFSIQRVQVTGKHKVCIVAYALDIFAN